MHRSSSLITCIAAFSALLIASCADSTGLDTGDGGVLNDDGNGGGSGGQGGGAGGRGGQVKVDAAPMCGPVCEIYCQYGNVKDSKGCPTCKCNPEPPADAGPTCGSPTCGLQSDGRREPPADAGPTCGPVCAIFCQYGNVTDDKGCPTCQCKPAPADGGTKDSGVTCGPVCKIYCEFGNVVDGNGCPTCKCNTQPPICPAIACVQAAEASDVATGAPALVAVPLPPARCAYGTMKDKNGCETCQCNPAPGCTKDECANVPMTLSQIAPAKCADGTTPAPVCDRNGNGTCGWHYPPCPKPVACTKEECGPIPPVAACGPGYSTDVTCGRSSTGKCGWTRSCTPVATGVCSGYRDTAACSKDERCSWLEPGCVEPKLATAGCYERANLNCMSDKECTGGRQCLKRVINPCSGAALRPAPGGGVSACAACGATITVCL